MIHDFNSSPLLIDAHRDYLRSLYRARFVSMPTSRRRAAPGTLWRRLGQALRRHLVADKTPLRPSSGVV